MTLRAAEKIAGLVITLYPDNMYCGKREDGEEFWVHARDDKDAAARLVALNWKDVSMKVIRRQDFKCLHCSRLTALSVHHIKFRSHGRRDHPSDLAALCQACHDREHGIFEGT